MNTFINRLESGFQKCQPEEIAWIQKQIYESDEDDTKLIGDFPANVGRDVGTIIHCSLVKDSYSDDNKVMVKNDLFYTFVPNK